MMPFHLRKMSDNYQMSFPREYIRELIGKKRSKPVFKVTLNKAKKRITFELIE